MRRRRGRGKASAEGNSIMTAAPPLSFSIPLKDTSKPVAFPATFQNHIALEFAMRYLSEIGATPTIENCRWVLREMPLENCSVTAAWRSRGCLADAIIIQPGGQRKGGGMGEASPSTPVESTPNNNSSGKDNASGEPELTGQATTTVCATGCHGSGQSRQGRRLTAASGRTKHRPVNTQPPPSMGRASPHKPPGRRCVSLGALRSTTRVEEPDSDTTSVPPLARKSASRNEDSFAARDTDKSGSTHRPRHGPHHIADRQQVSIFVDAVSSAVGPAIIETAKGSHATNVSGAVGAAAAAAVASQTAATTTARDRNNRRRRNGEMPARDICSSSKGPIEPHWEQRQQHVHVGQPVGGGRRYGVLQASLAAFSETEVGGDSDGVCGGDGVGAYECSVGNAIAFAEARRKMLDPPKVDMAAIATIQAAYARNFPFQKHGEKFADLNVRSSLKTLITSEGPGRLIGLLSHYLFWIILLPFAIAHKSRDDILLLETDNRLSLKKQQKDQTRFRVADGGSALETTVATPIGPVPPATITRSEDGEHGNVGGARGSASRKDQPGEGRRGGEAPQQQHSPTPSWDAKGGVTSSPFSGPPEETGPVSQSRLTPEEAESLFVAVVEAWSSLRSSLGASRRARLVQLPIAVAAVRHGVQTVLCNCFPFLDTKGGREGKRLLSSLHEEVAERFIPRFYYEGPFTPVADEEKEEAKLRAETAASDATAASATATRRTSSGVAGKRRGDRSSQGPPQGIREQNAEQWELSSPSPSTSSPTKKKTNFLETSATLLAARRWVRPGSDGAAPTSTLPVSDALDGDRPSTTTAAEIWPAGEAPHVVGGATAARFARERPGGTRRTGEALFATSTTLEYVFPKPCRTTIVTAESTGSPPPSRAASTPGARTRPLSTSTRGGANAAAVASTSSVKIVTSGVIDNKRTTYDPPRPGTTVAAEVIAAAGALLQRHPPQQLGINPIKNMVENSSRGGEAHPPTRVVTATSAAGKKTRFHDQTSWSKTETLRPSTTTAAKEIGPLRDHRGSDLGVGVDVCVRVGGVGVGAVAKARLYRGYCAQRGGDYDREYRRHGGKEALERIALLNDTFR